MFNKTSIDDTFMILQGLLDDLPKISHLVNELKQVQIKIFKLEEDLHNCYSILNNISEKVFIKSRDLSYVFCNEKFARDLKIMTDEVIGKTDYDFYPIEIAIKMSDDDRRVISQGEPDVIEYKCVINAQEKYIRFSRIPLKDNDSYVYGLMTILEDITENKYGRQEVNAFIPEFKKIKNHLEEEISMKEELIEKLEKKHSFLFNSDAMAKAIINENYIITSVNNNFENLFGLKRNEVENKLSFNEFLLSKSILNGDTKRTPILPNMQNDELIKKTDSYETYFINQQGKVKNIFLKIKPIPGSAQWFISFIDISLQKELKNEIDNIGNIIRELSIA